MSELKNLRNICAVVTPFGTDGKIDYKKHESHLNWLANNDVDAIVSLGTTGESPTVSFKEHSEMLKKVVTFSPLPVIAGAGGNSTEEAVKLTKGAEKAGAVAVLSVTPYYNRPNQEGLFQHYSEILGCTGLPVLLYNVPTRTGVNIEVGTVLRLRDQHKNFGGIKEASNNLAAVQQYVHNGINIYCGEDALNFPMLCLGAEGVISVVSNFAGQLVNKLILAIEKSDLSMARQINGAIVELAKAAFIDTNPIPTKYIVSRLGFCDNKLRLPLVPLTPEKMEIVDRLLKKILHWALPNNDNK